MSDPVFVVTRPEADEETEEDPILEQEALAPALTGTQLPARAGQP